MKKLAWLLGAAALVGLAACETDDTTTYNCDNTIDCDETTQLCVTKDYAKSGKAMCLDKATKQAVYDTCGNANATAKDQWIDEEGMCVTKYTGTCKSNSDCEGDQVCNAQSGICEAATDVKTSPKLVRIDDLSEVKPNAKKEDPGADIDAIVLTKANGNVYYATEVKDYKRADNQKKDDTNKMIAANPAMALDAPDSFIGYPTNTTKCYYYKKDAEPEDITVDRPFVSLGGQGGYLVVEMGDIIEAGDTLAVLELGKCELQNTKDGGSQKGIAEEIKVLVSITNHKESSDWSVVGDSSSNVSASDYTGIFTAKITDSMINAAK